NKIGRWLAQEHPDRADPGSWDRELAAAWVGRVDRILVGEFCSPARRTPTTCAAAPADSCCRAPRRT
ncbi:MAG: hypothetical protein WBP81_20785, partial [Solirubrobacteraceae bacterium]